jgi:hypothetical protein
MGCRISIPIVPEPVNSQEDNIMTQLSEIYHNYQPDQLNDSIIYSGSVISSFTETDIIKYQSINEDVLKDPMKIIHQKAENILRDYKKIIIYIIKKEKIDRYIYNFEKRLVHDWLDISPYLLNETQLNEKFNRYNMKYNLLINHFNSLYKIIEKRESCESGE